MLVSKGVDPATVALILGRNNPGVTMWTYVHGIQDRVHAGVALLDRVQKKV